jgi:hypothetical protein
MGSSDLMRQPLGNQLQKQGDSWCIVVLQGGLEEIDVLRELVSLYLPFHPLKRVVDDPLELTQL